MAYNLYTDGVTQGLLGDYLDCRQRCAFKIDGWRKEQLKDSLLYGSMAHEALEAIHSGQNPTPVIKEYQPETGEDYPNFDAMKEQLAVLMPAYVKYHSIRDRRKKTVAVEEKFDIEFGDYKLRGKIDWAYTIGKELWIADHKTKAQISTDTIQHSLLTNLQIQLYWIAAQILFDRPVAGFMYNIIRRPTHKTVKAFEDDLRKRPEHFFNNRWEIRLNKREFKVAEKELQYKLDEFKAWIGGELATFRNGAACTGRGWSCAYLPICAARDYTGFVHSDVIFPELED